MYVYLISKLFPNNKNQGYDSSHSSILYYKGWQSILKPFFFSQNKKRMLCSLSYIISLFAKFQNSERFEFFSFQ